MKQHGFAREMDWAVRYSSADPYPDERVPTVGLQISSDQRTYSEWSFDFTATIEISLLPEQLQVRLAVRNDSESGSEMSFTAGLHTYVEVVSTEQDDVGVTGLKGCTYTDKADNFAHKTEDRDFITFSDGTTTDSIYNTGETSSVQLQVGTGAGIEVYNQEGWTDHVVWSPSTDVPNNTKFVCLESAAASSPVSVPAQREWVGTMRMSVFDVVGEEGDTGKA